MANCLCYCAGYTSYCFLSNFASLSRENFSSRVQILLKLALAQQGSLRELIIFNFTLFCPKKKKKKTKRKRKKKVENLQFAICANWNQLTLHYATRYYNYFFSLFEKIPFFSPPISPKITFPVKRKFSHLSSFLNFAKFKRPIFLIYKSENSLISPLIFSGKFLILLGKK